MIKKDQLEALATKNQTTKKNVYREYCQHLSLSSLYQEKGAEKMLFKGGTALKIAYQSPRYSEDLDFSLFKISVHEIENLLLTIVEKLEKANLTPQIAESKQTSGGYLAKLTTRLYQEKIDISIQGSMRKKNGKDTNIKLIQNEFIPNYTVWLLPEKELVGEKIQAALTRNKPRDFFDVYYLLRNRSIPVSFRPSLQKMPQIIKEKRLDFAQLSEFLPNSMSALAKNFQNIFITEINKFK